MSDLIKPLAAAIHEADKFEFPTDEAYAEELLADPDFRVAFERGLAETLDHLDWGPFWEEHQPEAFIHEATFNRKRFARAMAARLFGETP